MNNKGFTLIEIIAVVGLLALIGVMVGTNLVSMNQKQNAKNYENYKTSILDAACLFFESRDAKFYSDATSARSETAANLRTREQCLSSTSGCYTSVKTLIRYGYLDESMINPATQAKVTNQEYACVKYVKGTKYCYYGDCA